ncbi:MAG: Sel1 domain protein repeat-containing protein [Hyperionvirus sp.]|uniref:Sel1 domain protein repeat-containing protein n=1 Tax=Hyperionvirus sp. TaxID=2487770 RepID=A0A3G5A5P5_9VIRU|nr:MAG: Sel1 domain protein repeat-containing protein [Hyperionvirus sp.]
MEVMDQEFYGIYNWIAIEKRYTADELISIIQGTRRNYCRFMIKWSSDLEIPILSWIIKKPSGYDFSILMGNLRNHVERKYGAAALWYIEGAKNGNAECLYEHGKMYEDYFLKPRAKGMDLYKEGADLCNEHCLMGFCRMGREDKINVDLVLKYYLKGIDLGFKQCYHELAEVYDEGIIVKQDLELANKYFGEGARIGDVSCILALGERHYLKKGFVKALEYFLAGVELNNGACMSYVAKYYAEGLVVERDMKKSHELLEKGIELGDPNCLDMRISGLSPDRPNFVKLLNYGVELNNSSCAKILGQKYLKEANEEFAFKYFVIGAILQNSECMESVASFYLKGTAFYDRGNGSAWKITYGDNATALRWYYDGARLKNINCILQAALLNESYPGNKKLAVTYYEQGIQLGSSECMFYYGKFLEKSAAESKIAPDSKILMNVYSRGAALNNSKCMNGLALLYEKKGDTLTGTEKDKHYELAHEWFEKATVDNNNMEALYDRGRFLSKINKKIEALRCFHYAAHKVTGLPQEFTFRCDVAFDTIVKEKKTEIFTTYFAQEERIKELETELAFKPGGEGYKLSEKSFNQAVSAIEKK